MAPRGAEAVVDKEEDLKAMVGKTVQVEGKAGNAKIAAAVQRPGVLVYCLNLREWPSAQDGATVKVAGKLEYTEEFAAKAAPSGAQAQGTDGGVYVIRACQTLQ